RRSLANAGRCGAPQASSSPGTEGAVTTINMSVERKFLAQSTRKSPTARQWTVNQTHSVWTEVLLNRNTVNPRNMLKTEQFQSGCKGGLACEPVSLECQPGPFTGKASPTIPPPGVPELLSDF